MKLNSTLQLHTVETIIFAHQYPLGKLIAATAHRLQINPRFMDTIAPQGQSNYPQFLVYSLAHYQLKMPVHELQRKLDISNVRIVLNGIKRLAEWTKQSDEVKEDIKGILAGL